MLPRKVASVLVRAVLMPRSLGNFGLYRFFLVNPRLAHLFMICSNIKLTGPAESIRIDAMAIHEWNQRDSTTAVQRKLEILADANLARSIPEASARWCGGWFKPKAAQLGF